MRANLLLALAAGVSALPEMLECSCEKVKCVCTKQCDCSVAGESFLQLQEMPLDWTPASEAALLQVEEASTALTPESLLRCECKKVQCNCIKNCDCALKVGETGQPLALAHIGERERTGERAGRDARRCRRRRACRSAGEASRACLAPRGLAPPQRLEQNVSRCVSRGRCCLWFYKPLRCRCRSRRTRGACARRTSRTRPRSIAPTRASPSRPRTASSPTF